MIGLLKVSRQRPILLTSLLLLFCHYVKIDGRGCEAFCFSYRNYYSSVVTKVGLEGGGRNGSTRVAQRRHPRMYDLDISSLFLNSSTNNDDDVNDVDKCDDDKNDLDNEKKQTNDSIKKWTHANIEWQLRPPEDTPLIEKLKIQAAAKAIHAECTLNDQPIPPVLCPKGGKAVLLAFEKNVDTGVVGSKQIAKFGITTTRGPPAPPIDETIQDIYGIDLPFNGAGVAAIIYMYVEPEYRKLGIGQLALEAIAAIQTVQGCDFTVLVADDDGSNKLVEWYQRNGYSLAPKLQDIFGSPGGKFGVTMIRPTQVSADIFKRCQIKWW